MHRYERIVPVAAGGMATIWAARLRGTAGFRKLVAIKAMLPELAREPEYRAMFLDEARVTSRLHHPNLCETFDAGEHEGELFIAMEWVEGASLYRLLKPSGTKSVPLELPLAARIVMDACAGLHAAHEATDDDGTPLAIVHRDVSPQNLLVSVDGHVKVSDFGIAEARGKSHATAAGQAKGKLAYMAPEQLREGDVDRRADVFALGCVLYEITTGKKPFDGGTDVGIAKAILEGTPARPSEIVPGYPESLERIVARAMKRDPNDRFPTAEGLRLALERWAAESGTRASEREVASLVHARAGDEIQSRRAKIRESAGERPTLPAPAEPAPRPGSRRRLALAAALAVTALVAGSLAWSSPAVTARKGAAPVAARTEPVVCPSPSTLSAPPVGSAPVSTTTTIAPAPVELRIHPTSARVRLDGHVVDVDEDGTAKIERLPGQDRTVLVTAEGRVEQRIVVSDGTADVVDVSLPLGEPTVLTSR